MSVAILCAARNSVYHELDGVEVYDETRSALTFSGGSPIVAHPPCRSWSAYCGHQAKPAVGERALAVWCCEMLKECGGVLEQPAHSRLFEYARLPLPGKGSDGLWTAEVWQSWWGYPLKKATWLCFSGVARDVVQMPLQLHEPRGDRRRQQVMSKNQRSATTREFAKWLVEVAQRSTILPTTEGESHAEPHACG